MVWAMYGAGGLTLATAIAPDWNVILMLRLLTGLALAGVPAVAMAYVSEEVDVGSVGSAICTQLTSSRTQPVRRRSSRWPTMTVFVAALRLVT